jgi:hypothetical protein
MSIDRVRSALLRLRNFASSLENVKDLIAENEILNDEDKEVFNVRLDNVLAETRETLADYERQERQITQPSPPRPQGGTGGGGGQGGQGSGDAGLGGGSNAGRGARNDFSWVCKNRCGWSSGFTFWWDDEPRPYIEDIHICPECESSTEWRHGRTTVAGG